jgi:hypothetical protein
MPLVLASLAAAAVLHAPESPRSMSWAAFDGLSCRHQVVDPHNSDSPFWVTLDFRCEERTGVCTVKREFQLDGGGFNVSTHTPDNRPGIYTTRWYDDSDSDQTGWSLCAGRTCTIHFHHIGSGDDSWYALPYELTDATHVLEGTDSRAWVYDCTSTGH